ncbi:uncharacterized protein LOC135484280 [Lineus longissimus]|uniref:uncharacterized protein LOC135484280 n=1 Tax=Lineus longissimus TaxID=88925 RepID=UPI00315D8EF8
MKNDDIKLVVKGDPLILKMGTRLYNKVGHDANQNDYIRKKLRQLGRFVKEFKSPLESAISPVRFTEVVTAVQAVAGFNKEMGTYVKPNLALKIGHSLNRCAGLMNGDGGKVTMAVDFLRLSELKWNECVSRTALRTVREEKFNKPKLLPLGNDVKKMHVFMSQIAEENVARIQSKENCNVEVWSELCKTTLAQIIMFNRRRSGEASKLTLATYCQAKGAAASIGSSDVNEALSPLEKKLSASFLRIETRGKKGRGVPILLTENMKRQIELLISKRKDVGVAAENPYVFARAHMSAKTPMRGSDCLRNISKACGASQPEALTSTRLRKHIATMSQILNLKDNELDMLANYMGHDIRVHREYYRLPDDTLQMTKVSRLLLAMERGVASYAGKSLEEIVMDPETTLQEWEMDNGGGEGDEDSDTEMNDSVPVSATSSDDSTAILQASDENSWAPRDRTDAEKVMPESACNTSDKKQKSQKGRIKKRSVPVQGERRPWSDVERKAVAKHLGHFLQCLKVPGRRDIDKAIAAESVLQGRSWLVIKSYVYNEVQRRKPKKQK